MKSKRAKKTLIKKSKKNSAKKPKMKSYATFDLWAKDQNPKHRKLINVLRNLVNKTSPSLTESVMWGNGCWIGKEWPVIYLFAGYDVMQLGFFGGSHLADSDPKRLLNGSGKYVRHILVPSLKDVDETAFKRLIKKATQNEREG